MRDLIQESQITQHPSRFTFHESRSNVKHYLLIVLTHGQRHHRLLRVEAVFRLVVDNRVGAVDDAVGDFDIAVRGQAVHVERVGFGQGHAPLVGDPVGVLAADLRRSRRCRTW
jgi:hypothetical protein